MKHIFNRLKHIITSDLTDLEFSAINLGLAIITIFWLIVLGVILPIAFIISLF